MKKFLKEQWTLEVKLVEKGPGRAGAGAGAGE